eukprot:scaffold74286_cov62-Attheya_sp.AAC.2
MERRVATAAGRISLQSLKGRCYGASGRYGGRKNIITKSKRPTLWSVGSLRRQEEYHNKV